MNKTKDSLTLINRHIMIRRKQGRSLKINDVLRYDLCWYANPPTFRVFTKVV